MPGCSYYAGPLAAALLDLVNTVRARPMSAPVPSVAWIPGGIRLTWRFQNGLAVVDDFSDVFLDHLRDRRRGEAS